MTVYDLDKEATPAPWPTDLMEAVGGESGTTCHESNCNERLARHCRNNFMRALEALKHDVDPSRVQHSDECTSRSPDSPPLFIDEDCNCWVADRKKLIKELETV